MWEDSYNPNTVAYLRIPIPLTKTNMTETLKVLYGKMEYIEETYELIITISLQTVFRYKYDTMGLQLM